MEERIEQQKELSYEIIEPNKDSYVGEPLSAVIGLGEQKKVLVSAINWFKKSETFRSKGVDLPRGFLLYGEPGNGKTLLIKEVIKCSEAPVFVFKGNASACDIPSDLESMFQKVKEVGHAVVIIDELDLLISSDNRVARILQDNLDGVNSHKDMLVICATNNIDEIPEALRRNGRLEKVMRIMPPTGNECVLFLKKSFNDLGVKLPDDFRDEDFAAALDGVSCASIKAIVNETILKNGFERITSDMIYDSIFAITNGAIDDKTPDIYENAVHEAGHALVAKAFDKYFRIGRLVIHSSEGYMSVSQIDREYWPHDKMIADIKISMAGLLAEKLIFKKGGMGCDSDMQWAYKRAALAVNRVGYLSCANTLPDIPRYMRVRNETEARRSRNEAEIEKLLRKCERNVCRYLKSNKKLLIEIADELFAKKNLKSFEVNAIIDRGNGVRRVALLMK